MKTHIFALRWRDEIKRSSQPRTLLKRVVVNTTTHFSSVLSCEDLLISTEGFLNLADISSTVPLAYLLTEKRELNAQKIACNRE